METKFSHCACCHFPLNCHLSSIIRWKPMCMKWVTNQRKITMDVANRQRQESRLVVLVSILNCAHARILVSKKSQENAPSIKGGEIRDTKTLNLSRNIVAFQVFGRCFSFFTLQDQLVAQQKHLLWVEEMQHADWLICLLGIQDGGITTNLLRDKLRVWWKTSNKAPCWSLC